MRGDDASNGPGPGSPPSWRSPWCWAPVAPRTTATRPGQEARPRTPASVDRLRLSGGDYGYPSPFAYLRGAGLILASYIFDTLLWEDSTGDPIPWLAKEWSHSPDGLEWRFTLRDNVKWQDGQPLTADDVKFSFDYMTTGAAASTSRLAPSLDLKEVVVESPDRRRGPAQHSPRPSSRRTSPCGCSSFPDTSGRR